MLYICLLGTFTKSWMCALSYRPFLRSTLRGVLRKNGLLIRGSPPVFPLKTPQHLDGGDIRTRTHPRPRRGDDLLRRRPGNRITSARSYRRSSCSISSVSCCICCSNTAITGSLIRASIASLIALCGSSLPVPIAPPRRIPSRGRWSPKTPASAGVRESRASRGTTPGAPSASA